MTEVNLNILELLSPYLDEQPPMSPLKVFFEKHEDILNDLLKALYARVREESFTFPMPNRFALSQYLRDDDGEILFKKDENGDETREEEWETHDQYSLMENIREELQHSVSGFIYGKFAGLFTRGIGEELQKKYRGSTKQRMIEAGLTPINEDEEFYKSIYDRLASLILRYTESLQPDKNLNAMAMSFVHAVLFSLVGGFLQTSLVDLEDDFFKKNQAQQPLITS